MKPSAVTTLSLLALLAVSTACAPIYGSAAYGRPGMYPRPAPSATAPPAMAPSVTGRWDNVMMLGSGASIVLLTMDGRMAEGFLIGATSSEVRMEVASGTVTFAAAEVARVDRVHAPVDHLANGARGAGYGLGVVGVLSLLAGKAPPPRIWAAGAIIGAQTSIHANSLTPGPLTVYIAENLGQGR